MACKITVTAASVVCFGLQEHLFIKAITNARMYVTGMFKKCSSICFQDIPETSFNQTGMCCVRVTPVHLLLCFHHRERSLFLSGGQKNSNKKTLLPPKQLPFSPVPDVFHHLYPPAGPCPGVARWVPVSKQTGEIPGPQAESASEGDTEKSVSSGPVKQLDSLSLVHLVISFHNHVRSPLSSQACSRVLKCLTGEFIEGNGEPLREFQNIVAQSYTSGVY